MAACPTVAHCSLGPWAKRWIPDIVPFLTEDDPLGVDECATHRLPLADPAAAYGMFQRKADGAVKIMLKPWS